MTEENSMTKTKPKTRKSKPGRFSLRDFDLGGITPIDWDTGCAIF